MIHFDKLIPTVYSISHEEQVDIGVAESMLQGCILHGTAQYKGSDAPKGFAPDYLELFDASRTTGEGEPGFNAEFNAFVQKVNANYKALCALWGARDCAGMVALLEADTADYGLGTYANTLEEAQDVQQSEN